MIKVIGIGEYAVSSNEEDIIKTFALGSCVALVIHNPVIKILGMVHIALPDSTEIKDSSNNLKAGYFADIAVPMLFNKVCGGFMNYSKEFKVSLFGGAFSRNERDVFNVGQKNIIKIKDILYKNNVTFDCSNTGDYYSRTIEVDVRTGTPKLNVQPINI